jgi:hypothetical protein
MKNSINTSGFFKSFGRLIARFNMTLFILAILGALIYAVISINGMLNKAASDTNYTPTNTLGGFDSTVMDQVNKLHTSDTPLNITLPDGRINPFSE